MELDGASIWDYKDAKGLCIRPLSPISTELGYFNHCMEHPQVESNQSVEDEFFSGRGRFYNYDIKLDVHVGIDEYKRFITEFLRRGETSDCLIHFSNSMWDITRDKHLVSIYDLPHLLEFIEITTSIPQPVFVDLDDKRFAPTTQRELIEVTNLCRILGGMPNVHKFAMSETRFTRHVWGVKPTDKLLVLSELNYKELLTNEE